MSLSKVLPCLLAAFMVAQSVAQMPWPTTQAAHGQGARQVATQAAQAASQAVGQTFNQTIKQTLNQGAAQARLQQARAVANQAYLATQPYSNGPANTAMAPLRPQVASPSGYANGYANGYPMGAANARPAAVRPVAPAATRPAVNWTPPRNYGHVFQAAAAETTIGTPMQSAAAMYGIPQNTAGAVMNGATPMMDGAVPMANGAMPMSHGSLPGMVGQAETYVPNMPTMESPLVGDATPFPTGNAYPQQEGGYYPGPVIDTGAGCGTPAGGQDVYGSLWTDQGGGWDAAPAPAVSGGYVGQGYVGGGYTGMANGGGCRGLCEADPCAPAYWYRAELLLGWLNGFSTPRLLTTSPAGTELDDFSDDRTLIGGREFGRDLRIGGRIAGGFWFDDCRKFGFQAEGFSFGNDEEESRTVSNGDPFLGRPFFNTNPGVNGPDLQVLAYPGTAIGTFDVRTNGRLVSAAPSFRWNVNCCSDCGTSRRLDLIAGYRFLQLREGLDVTEVLRPQNGNYPDNASFTLRDDIDAQNDFHGFEIGGIHMTQSGNWMTELQFLAAFGSMNRIANLNGSTAYFEPGSPVDSYPGGFLVRPENVGSYSENQFTVIPQFRMNLAYCLTRNVRLTVGYNFLYVADVFRPGLLASTRFDGSTLGVDPGSNETRTPQLNNTDAYLNALTFGASYNF